MSPKITVAFIAVVLLTGCSALGRVTALHSETDGWVARPPIPERSHAALMRYEFAQPPVTVKLPASVGPVGLPNNVTVAQPPVKVRLNQ